MALAGALGMSAFGCGFSRSIRRTASAGETGVLLVMVARHDVGSGQRAGEVDQPAASRVQLHWRGRSAALEVVGRWLGHIRKRQSESLLGGTTRLFTVTTPLLQLLRLFVGLLPHVPLDEEEGKGETKAHESESHKEFSSEGHQ